MIKKNSIKYFLIIFVILSCTGALTLPYLLELTSTPEFCSACHVMAPQYEDWFYSGVHKQIKCVDCHLPNNNIVNHLIWKGIDGMKDVIYFYTGMVPEKIQSSSHAKKTLKSNCLRCHEETVSRISSETMNCWECHRYIFHNIRK